MGLNNVLKSERDESSGPNAIARCKPRWIIRFLQVVSVRGTRNQEPCGKLEQAKTLNCVTRRSRPSGLRRFVVSPSLACCYHVVPRLPADALRCWRALRFKKRQPLPTQ